MPATAATYQTDLSDRPHRLARVHRRAARQRRGAGRLDPVADGEHRRRSASAPATRRSRSRWATTRRLRRPVGLSFTGTAGDDAKLLGFALRLRARGASSARTPSEINPQTWHCVAPVVYIPRTCGPGELSAPEPLPNVKTLPVGGTVPATLSLTLGAPATFGAFAPGVATEYTASTTANVISTAGDAPLTVSDPGHLMNGAFSAARAAAGDRPAEELRRAGLQRPGDDRLQARRSARATRCAPGPTPRR